jgi:predicted O-methyltransferase YrrM
MEAGVDIAADPLELWIKLEEKYADWSAGRQPAYRYESNEDWESQLHLRLGVEWPCNSTSEFWDLWSEVMEALERGGIRAGPGSFRAWNDGDAALTRAIWCLVRHLRPKSVVETGVARGVTSRVILEALERNGQGHLWSIDLPPLERIWQKQVGVAVGDRHKTRWSYIKGSSRRRLPRLLAQLGQIDLFIHDSLHSNRNVLFELEHAWAAVRPGGAIIVDDIDVNGAFKTFTRTLSPHQFMICDAAPLYPDLRRFNKKGLFGIILKE